MAERITPVLLSSLLCISLATGCGETGKSEITPTRAISTLTLPPAKAGTPAGGTHFVTSWLLLGPFAFEEEDFGGGHQQAAADKCFIENEGALDGTQKAPEGASWKEKQFESFNEGMIDLDGIYGGIDHAAAYAVCWLYCDTPLPDATILTGSDDYITVWVNGKKVHCYKTERRACEPDQDTIEGVCLKKGYNRIVIKCIDVVLGWNFYFRVVGPSGGPIAVTATPVPKKK